MKVLAFNGSVVLCLLDAGYLPYDDDKKVRLFFNQGGGYVPVWLWS